MSWVAVENPKLILIVGGVGLGLNVLVLSFLHGKSCADWTRLGSVSDALQSTTTAMGMTTVTGMAIAIAIAMRMATVTTTRPKKN